LEALRASRPRIDVQAWMLETEWLRSDLAGSSIGRAALMLRGAIGRAWSTAAVRPFVEAGVDACRRLTVVERVRVAGIWAVTAALTVAMLSVLDPRPIGGTRWALWTGFLVLGAMAAAWPRPLTGAWNEWRGRRVLRAKESE
jgi:hypothetical protein